VNFGIGFQATVPNDIRIYLGPYIYYSETKISPSASIPGLEFSAGEVQVENKTWPEGLPGSISLFLEDSV